MSLKRKWIVAGLNIGITGACIQYGFNNIISPKLGYTKLNIFQGILIYLIYILARCILPDKIIDNEENYEMNWFDAIKIPMICFASLTIIKYFL